MTDKLEDTSLRLKDEMDLYRKMMDKLRQNRQQFQKEKEEMQEVGVFIVFYIYKRCSSSSPSPSSPTLCNPAASDTYKTLHRVT